MNSKKKTGSYYTPLDLADFIVQHLKPSLNDTNSILEPSVGDGAFIKTIIANNIPVNQISIVDINDEHFKNIQSIIPQEININTYKEDFLEYNNENKSSLYKKESIAKGPNRLMQIYSDSSGA